MQLIPAHLFPLSIGYVGAPSRWKRQVHIICWCDISATARKTFVTKLLEEIVGVNSVIQVRLVQILATGAPFHTLCRNPVIVKGQVDIIQTTLKALQVYHVFNEGHDWQQFLAITASSQPTMPPSSFFELLSIFLVEVFKSLPPSFLSSSQVVRHSPWEISVLSLNYVVCTPPQVMKMALVTHSWVSSNGFYFNALFICWHRWVVHMFNAATLIDV